MQEEGLCLTMPNHDPMKQNDEPTVIGPNSAMKIGFVVVLGGFVWWAASFRTQMVTDMAWVKTSLATLVTRFNELDIVQAQIKMMDKDGTVALKDSLLKVQELAQKVAAYEKYGSPADVARFDAIVQRLTLMERDMERHRVLDEERFNKSGIPK
jgi:hypothetical protein